jgi:hydrogenase maturation protein HypF
LAITVRGVVQGVGFRPFVYNTATRLGLGGWVLNEADTVRIEAQGERAALDGFLDALRRHAPPQARVDAVEAAEIAPADERATGEQPVFEIRTSDGRAAPRPTIPADLGTCRDCLAEIQDRSQRRYRYPFTNCTNCGPRWSIIRQLPYDRPRTSMAAFAMCAECQAEYDHPADRRFHAQPIACPRCGPTLQLLDGRGGKLASGDAALAMSVEALLAGRIVAIKGLGGFQLLVDASDAEAVARLRERKHRPDRPFAVMLPSLDDVRLCCEVSAAEAEALVSPQAPIVLLRRRAGGRCTVADGRLPAPEPSPKGRADRDAPEPPAVRSTFLVEDVAPNNPYLGVMLPYTPLHHLLMQGVGRAMVCTSGNLSEEPMAITTEDAIRRLSSIADVLLTHDRPIVRPVDDSIVRVGGAGMQVLRRARGFAPVPLEIARNSLPSGCSVGRATPTLLAVGGHLKNAVALCLGGGCTPSLSPRNAQVVMSAHVGDLDSVRSVQVFRRAIDDLLDFFQAKPDAVVCDLHPDYASTRHAESLAARWNVPLLRVQHHHAHVAACMAEHALTGPVLGFSWDGTGYGADGTVWGGETLLCDDAGCRRVAHLRTFALPGGDRAARQPRRSAFGLLHEMFGQRAAEFTIAWFQASEIEALEVMLVRRLHSPRTSSMGRLFDAVAALCGLPTVISFEGQAAMALEYAADEDEDAAYSFGLGYGEAFDGSCDADRPHPQPLCRPTFGRCPARGEAEPPRPHSQEERGDAALVIDWEPVLREVLADRAAGVSVARVSARFHNALAEMATAVACSAGCRQVALTGGCFQNALLADRTRRRLASAGFDVYTHMKVPPGDGGIALGQLLLGLRQF